MTKFESTADVTPVLQQLPTEAAAGSGRNWHAFRLLLLTLLLRPFGNLSLAWGMTHFSQTLALNPFIYLRALANPYVALGIGLLILALLTRMALLSVADLSFVLPLTAAGYIVSSLLGMTFLHEAISRSRWLGIAFIAAGISLVSATAVSSKRTIERGSPPGF